MKQLKQVSLKDGESKTARKGSDIRAISSPAGTFCVVKSPFPPLDTEDGEQCVRLTVGRTVGGI